MARHRAVNMDPSCWTCKLGRYEPGGMASLEIQPDPDHMECTLMDIKEGLPFEIIERLDEIEWVEEKCPAICGHYEPVMIDNCGHCGEPMNVPAHSHTHYVSNSYADPIAVHEVCKPAAEVKMREEELRIEREEREYNESLKAEDL